MSGAEHYDDPSTRRVATGARTLTGAASLLIAVMAFEVAGTLDLSDEQLVYVREADADDVATIDLENTPALSLDLAWPTAALGFDYAPRFLWTEVTGPDPSPTLVLHTGGAFASWHAPRISLGLGQTFAIGDQSYARLTIDRGSAADGVPVDGAPLTPGLDLLPDATIVRVAAAESSATLRYAWSRRLSSVLRPSYAISGGLDAAAQRALPQQRTARADLAFEYRATRRDGLDTELGIARIWTSNGFDHVLGTALESWSRGFTPESGGELGVGFAVSQTTGPMDRVTNGLGPIGAASLWQTVQLERVQVELDLSAGYRPHVNVLSGSLQDRLFASAQATAALREASVRFALSGTQTYPRDALDAAESVSADLSIERALLDWLIAELGGQLVWQRIGPSELAIAGSRAMVYAGLRGQVPHVRF